MFEELTKRYPALSCCQKQLEQAAELLKDCFSKGGKLLVCGNGGSAADSGHIAGELMKDFRFKRPIPAEEQQRLAALFPEDGAALAKQLQRALPVISLPDQTALFTAWTNDASAETAYAQMVYGYGKPEDLLLALSTSGNSANVLQAARAARLRDMKIIALTGARPCELDELSDVAIHVPETDTALVQELHLPVYHALCAWCEESFFSSAEAG